MSHNPYRYIVHKHTYDIVFDTESTNPPGVIYYPVQTVFRSYSSLPIDYTFSFNSSPNLNSFSSNTSPNLNSFSPNTSPGFNSFSPNSVPSFNSFSSNSVPSFNLPTEQNSVVNSSNRTYHVESSRYGSPYNRDSRYSSVYNRIIRPPPGLGTNFEQLLDSDFFQIIYPYLEDVTVTLTEDQFNELETISTQIIEENCICSICQETLTCQPMVKILPCDHMFHIDCAKQWLCRSSCKCPICRYDIRNSF